MMHKRHYREGLRRIVITLGLALMASAEAQTIGLSVDLPVCGRNPSDNTSMLQEALDDAGPGATLVLAPGVCVIAKSLLSAKLIGGEGDIRQAIR